MAYVAFDVCSVPIDGIPKRGVKAVCGWCGSEETLPVNTIKNYGDGDDKTVERKIAEKFERIGWLIGRRRRADNRCKSCFTAIKVKSKKGQDMKVVPINPLPTDTAVQPPPSKSIQLPPFEMVDGSKPSREERRIIHNKISEVYRDEKHGYKAGWCDQTVAKDLGVANVEWVSEIRDEYFGPDTDEVMVQTTDEAKGLLEEAAALKLTAESMMTEITAMAEKCSRMERELFNLLKRE